MKMFGGVWTAPKKKYTLVGAVLLFAYGVVIFVSQKPAMKEEEKALLKDIGELRIKLQYLQTLHQLQRQDMFTLQQNLNRYFQSSQNKEASEVLFNITNYDLILSNSSIVIKPPTVYNFLPHLAWNPSSLRPALRLSKGRTEVSVVMGIPTVKRPAQSYLLSTLSDLLQKLTPAEKNDTLIILLIAEADMEYVMHVTDLIKTEFEPHLESGLLEIISPPSSYYPDLNNIRTSLGDSLVRTHWRSKQNLDYAFLMMYAYPKGTFYVQLEDDIIAKDNFLSIMKNTAYQRMVSNEDWFVLDFCQLGFIGKMLRCVDLPWLIQFFLMFYTEKPVDWLLHELVQTKVCSLEEDSKKCRKRKDELWVHTKQSLFQHIGAVSSLKGKVQKLKDKQFGKVALFIPHKNPPAVVETSIRSYKSYTLTRAYRGEAFFWGMSVKCDDYMIFKFNEYARLKRFRFKTGNIEHPSDTLNNAVVQSLPVETVTNSANYSTTATILGTFNKMGVAENVVDPNLGFVAGIKIVLKTNSSNWLILSEILIEAHKQ